MPNAWPTWCSCGARNGGWANCLSTLPKIAPYAMEVTQQEKAAYLREAQFRAQSLIPNSAMISTNDLVEPYEMYNIHPRNKTKVGQRLSYLALNLTYGLKQIHCFGPQYKSWTAKGSEAWVSFDHWKWVSVATMTFAVSKWRVRTVCSILPTKYGCTGRRMKW